MKNKHVNGAKNYCQLNQFSSCQRILLTEMWLGGLLVERRTSVSQIPGQVAAV